MKKVITLALLAAAIFAASTLNISVKISTNAAHAYNPCDPNNPAYPNC